MSLLETGYGDQREVGGAAADIDDQDEVADLDALPPVSMAFNPGVEGSLRLFEQNQVLVACLRSRALRQLAGDGIKRRWNGHQHLLLFKRSFRAFVIPGITQMVQIPARCFERRHLRHAVGGVRRENAGRTIDARVG
jgi:hypothetical protein